MVAISFKCVFVGAAICNIADGLWIEAKSAQGFAWDLQRKAI